MQTLSIDDTYINMDNVSNLAKHELDFINSLNSNPNNIISQTDIDDGETNHTLISNDENYSTTLSLKVTDFENEKEFKKFVSNVKRMVRGSYEYKLWSDYIRNVMALNRCELSSETGTEVTIEIHHHPIALEHICEAVMYKNIENKKPFSTFDVSTQVIDLHFQMKVGFIPLITTLHEKFHNGFLHLPIDLVHGNFKYLLDNYYFSDEVMELINKYMQITTKTSKSTIQYTNCS